MRMLEASGTEADVLAAIKNTRCQLRWLFLAGTEEVSRSTMGGRPDSLASWTLKERSSS
jgi:hypothetical protein